MVEIESFDEFYLGTRATLLGQLTAMTADPEVAKEVLQDAYAQAWQRWSRRRAASVFNGLLARLPPRG